MLHLLSQKILLIRVEWFIIYPTSHHDKPIISYIIQCKTIGSIKVTETILLLNNYMEEEVLRKNLFNLVG